MNWFQWLYKQFFDKGYEAGHEIGHEQGKTEGIRFVELMRKYGNIEHIPTDLILRELPSQGPSMVERQRTKKALLALDKLMEECSLSPLPKTYTLIERYLTMEELDEEEGHQISTLLKSPTRVGGLIMLGAILDDFNVDQFMGKLKEFGLIKDYQTTLNDETLKVA